jgi:cytochrome P450
VCSQNLSAVAYDPYQLDVRSDPYPYYQLLRDKAPAYHVVDHDFWCISRYGDVSRALPATDAYSSADGIGVDRAPNLGDAELPASVRAIGTAMIAMDPPDHTRLRRLVQREFTRGRIAQWETIIEALSDELVDQLIAFNGRADADIARDVATPLPVMVILDMLDIPREDREEFKQWSDQVVYLIGGGIDPALQVGAVDAALELARYFEKLVDQRLASPGDDLVSLFCKSAPSGDRLSHSEIIGQCILFLVGGNETTTNLIGNTVNALMLHPEQRALLEESPELIPAAIEEVLRWDAPVQGLFRTTRKDVDIDGTTIPADSRVQLVYGSANRDERHYTDADQFQISRNPRDHLAFAGGPHYCIGAPLARLETKIVLEALIRRTRNMRPAGDPTLNLNILVRGFRNLPVTFDTVD